MAITTFEANLHSHRTLVLTLTIYSAHDGLGITVSYWRDEDRAQRWKPVMEHQAV
ncbi:unnamed protein product [Acidithrix sp. C25]|nr:unnamed protein product [Acidithrix sp. C25]